MERTDTLTAAQGVARVQMKQTPTWLYARAAVPRRAVVGVLCACSPTITRTRWVAPSSDRKSVV